ncbi:hypothetical protein [Micromonospora wenchangensis]|uniref:hypothetical protein n=1 Tax=Micromonospora wenchangensis TaxID=1185415 RepID=UPI00381E5BC2
MTAPTGGPVVVAAPSRTAGTGAGTAVCSVTAGGGAAGVGSTRTPSRPAAYAANGPATSAG